MFLQREARREVKGLADLIDYFGLVADGVVVTTAGVYMAAWEFEGNDMDSTPIEQCFAICRRLERNFALGAAWSLQCDLIRDEYTEYSAASTCWPDPLSMLVEEERRARFLLTGVEGTTRLSRRFFCLSYESKEKGLRARAKKIVGSGEDIEETPEAELERFQQKVHEIEHALTANLKTVRRLKGYARTVGVVQQHCDELLEYLRACVTGEFYPFAVPAIPTDLNQYIATDDFTGGGNLQLNDPKNPDKPGKYIRVLVIDSFPDVSFAGILRELDAVPLTFRFSQQAQIMDEQDATKKHKANKSMWKSLGTGGLKGKLRTPALDELDDGALSLAGDAKQAASSAEHGQESFCRYAGKIILMHSNLAVLRESILTIERAIRMKCGFGVHLETVNAVAAWLGSFPGHQYKDSRLFMVTTANLTHMMPLSQPFRGLKYNPSPLFPAKSPPLFMPPPRAALRTGFTAMCRMSDTP